MKPTPYIFVIVIVGALACQPVFAAELSDSPAHFEAAKTRAGGQKSERSLPAMDATHHVSGLNKMPARSRITIPQVTVPKPTRVPLKNSVTTKGPFTPFHNGNQPGAGKPVAVDRKQPNESEISKHPALPIHAGTFAFPTSPNNLRVRGPGPAAIGGLANSTKGTAALNGTGMKRSHYP